MKEKDPKIKSSDTPRFKVPQRMLFPIETEKMCQGTQ